MKSISPILVAGVLASVFAGVTARGQTFTYSGQTPGSTTTPTTGNFTLGFNGDGAAGYATPTSGATTTLAFNGPAGDNYTATDDLGDPFTIGGLSFGNAGNVQVVAGTGTTLTQGAATAIALNNTGTLNFGLNLANGGFLTTFTTTGTTGASTFSGAISGTAGLTKAGAGTLTLAGANSYVGATNISAGTLGLSGGDNRLLNTGTVNFSGSSTLNLGGAISQTLGNITVANGFTGTVTGATATLTVTATTFSIGGTASGATQTLDLSGLGTFNYNNAAGAFNVGGNFPTNGFSTTQTGTVTLAPTSTITALSVGLSAFDGGNMAGFKNQATLNLGATTTINANTITVSGSQTQGTINYGGSTANPTLTLRGTDGSSRVTSFVIGQSAGGYAGYSSLVDLTTNVTGTGALDAKIATLTIGNNTRTSALGNSNSNITTGGTLLMGGGTLDATTIILGQDAAIATSTKTATTNGTLTVTGGTVKVNTLSLGNQNASNATDVVNGTFNLNGGANLYAGTINKGAGAGTQATTRTFNWNDGTIHNYDANTDLTINSLASTGATTTFALLGTGTHTFNIDNGRQGTVAQIISGAAGTTGLTKAGAGTLTITGANIYTGGTTITGGILVTGTTGTLGTGPVTLMTGAALTLGNSATIASTGLLSFASGTTITLNNSSTDIVAGITFSDNGKTENQIGVPLSATDLNTYFGTPNLFMGPGFLQVVPEPSTWVWTALLLGGLAARQVRRSRPLAGC